MKAWKVALTVLDVVLILVLIVSAIAILVRMLITGAESFTDYAILWGAGWGCFYGAKETANDITERWDQ